VCSRGGGLFCHLVSKGRRAAGEVFTSKVGSGWDRLTHDVCIGERLRLCERGVLCCSQGDTGSRKAEQRQKRNVAVESRPRVQEGAEDAEGAAAPRS
jgi:hypothetical protein